MSARDWAEEYMRRHPEAMRLMDTAIEKERQMRDALAARAEALDKAIDETERLSEEARRVDELIDAIDRVSSKPIEEVASATEDLNTVASESQKYWASLNNSLKFLFDYPEVVANLNQEFGTTFKSVKDVVDYLNKIKDPLERWREANRIAKVGDQFFRDYRDSVVQAQMDFARSYWDSIRRIKPLWNWIQRNWWRPEPIWAFNRALRHFTIEMLGSGEAMDAVAETYRKPVGVLEDVGRFVRVGSRAWLDHMKAAAERMPSYVHRAGAAALAAGKSFMLFGDKADYAIKKALNAMQPWKKYEEIARRMGLIPEVQVPEAPEGLKERVEKLKTLKGRELIQEIRNILAETRVTGEEHQAYVAKWMDNVLRKLGTSLEEVSKKSEEIAIRTSDGLTKATLTYGTLGDKAVKTAEKIKAAKAPEIATLEAPKIETLPLEELAKRYVQLEEQGKKLNEMWRQLSPEEYLAKQERLRKATTALEQRFLELGYYGAQLNELLERFRGPERFYGQFQKVVGVAAEAFEPYLENLRRGVKHQQAWIDWLKRIEKTQRPFAVLNWALKYNVLTQEQASKIAQKFTSDLKKLGGASAVAAKIVKQKEQAHAEASQQIDKMRESEEKLNRTHRRQERMLGRLARGFRRLGSRIGFYGWILSYAGRSTVNMYRQVWSILSRVMRTSADWTRTMETMATTMGLIDATGVKLGRTYEMLETSLEDLQERGLQIQATWSGIQALISSVAVAFGVELLPHLEQFAASLAELAGRADFQAFIVNLADFIGTRLLPSLLTLTDIFVRLWPAMRPAVEGFLTMLTAISPILPVVSMLGTALWLLGPAFTAIGAALEVVNVSLLAHTAYTKMSTDQTLSQIAATYGTVPALLAATRARLGNVAATMAQAKANLVAAATSKVLSTANLKAALTSLLTSKYFWVAIGALVAMVGIVTQLQRMWTNFGRVYRSTAIDLGFSTFGFTRTVVDQSGEVLYTIDQMSNTVRDASGQIIGSYDSMSGAIVDSSGEVIGILDQASGAFVDSSGDIVGSLSGIETSLGTLAESFNQIMGYSLVA